MQGSEFCEAISNYLACIMPTYQNPTHLLTGINFSLMVIKGMQTK